MQRSTGSPSRNGRPRPGLTRPIERSRRPPDTLQGVNATAATQSPRGPALVTGGTGFLGRRIVERLLSQGRAVSVAGRTPAPDLEARGVRFMRAPLEDPGALGEACAGMDTVFHVAARGGGWGRYSDFFRANVLGTRAVVAGCRTHGVRRLVHTSTPSVVYNGLDLAGADESLPLTTRCPSPYPLTKAAAEAEVLAAHTPELGTVALRPHLIWGPGDPHLRPRILSSPPEAEVLPAHAPELGTVALRPHLIWGPGDPHLVPRILSRAREGRLRIVGEGRIRVDMVHVDRKS